MSSSSLSGIPADRRRRLAATLGLFAALFVAVGAVAATGRGSSALPVFTGIALGIGVLLLLMAWGVMRSVHLDARAGSEQDIDDMLESVVAEHNLGCGCGHDHDLDEMHVQAGPDNSNACHSADAAGTDCAHDCDTCVLTALRPAPDRTRAERLG